MIALMNSLMFHLNLLSRLTNILKDFQLKKPLFSSIVDWNFDTSIKRVAHHEPAGTAC
jgi:hypothetical protein